MSLGVRLLRVSSKIYCLNFLGKLLNFSSLTAFFCNSNNDFKKNDNNSIAMGCCGHLIFWGALLKGLWDLSS